MLRNYFKTAWRSLLKYKAFSAINIFGLALSMSVGLLIILVVRDAYSFDKFHPEGDRVYRVLTTALRKDGGAERYASSPYPVGRALTEQYALTEAWVPLVNTLGGEAEVDGKQLPFRGLFTTGDFLRYLVLSWLPETKEPYWPSLTRSC